MKHINSFESFKMFEAFQTEDGKMVSQKDIVNGILFALQSCEGKFEKFREQLSRVQKDEKVIKQLFDTYRPASQLTAKAFIWMINKIYCGLVKNEYRRFNIQVINRLGVNVVLKDEQTTVGQIAAGGTRFIESGPYRYNNSPGFYYNTGNTLKELSNNPVDLEIVITPNHWEMDAKSQEGTKILEALLRDKTSFDLYSGYYEADKFFFKLYKFKAPKAQIKPLEGEPKKEEAKKEETVTENMDTVRVSIPEEFSAAMKELGEAANPDDIIKLYNYYVEEGTPLVSYSNGFFTNRDGQEIPEFVILDELNYSLEGRL